MLRVATDARLRVDAWLCLLKVNSMSVRVAAKMLGAVPHPVTLDVTSEDEHVANIELRDFPHPIVWSHRHREARASHEHDIKHDAEGGVGRQRRQK